MAASATEQESALKARGIDSRKIVARLCAAQCKQASPGPGFRIGAARPSSHGIK